MLYLYENGEPGDDNKRKSPDWGKAERIPETNNITLEQFWHTLDMFFEEYSENHKEKSRERIHEIFTRHSFWNMMKMLYLQHWITIIQDNNKPLTNNELTFIINLLPKLLFYSPDSNKIEPESIKQYISTLLQQTDLSKNISSNSDIDITTIYVYLVVFFSFNLPNKYFKPNEQAFVKEQNEILAIETMLEIEKHIATFIDTISMIHHDDERHYFGDLYKYFYRKSRSEINITTLQNILSTIIDTTWIIHNIPSDNMQERISLTKKTLLYLFKDHTIQKEWLDNNKQYIMSPNSDELQQGLDWQLERIIQKPVYVHKNNFFYATDDERADENLCETSLDNITKKYPENIMTDVVLCNGLWEKVWWWDIALQKDYLDIKWTYYILHTDEAHWYSTLDALDKYTTKNVDFMWEKISYHDIERYNIDYVKCYATYRIHRWKLEKNNRLEF